MDRWNITNKYITGIEKYDILSRVRWRDLVPRKWNYARFLYIIYYNVRRFFCISSLLLSPFARDRALSISYKLSKFIFILCSY